MGDVPRDFDSVLLLSTDNTPCGVLVAFDSTHYCDIVARNWNDSEHARRYNLRAVTVPCYDTLRTRPRTGTKNGTKTPPQP